MTMKRPVVTYASEMLAMTEAIKQKLLLSEIY